MYDLVHIPAHSSLCRDYHRAQRLSLLSIYLIFLSIEMPHVEPHFRECMLYEFDLKHNAAEATRNICTAYGEDALTLRTCQLWFARFRSGQRDLSDEPHTGRPIEFDQEALRALIEDDPRQSTRVLTTKFNCSNTTIDHHLHAIGKTNKHGVWVSHEMSTQCCFRGRRSAHLCLVVMIPSRFSTELSLVTRSGFCMLTRKASASGFLQAKSRCRGRNQIFTLRRLC